MTMNAEKIEHIGIAVKKLEDHIDFYQNVLGLEYLGIEEVEEQKVRVAMFKTGQSVIELLEPTSNESPISGFLEKKGEGLHHLCFKVPNVDKAIEVANDKNIAMIDKKPRIGAGGSKIAFIHPKSSGKVLMELTEGGHHC